MTFEPRTPQPHAAPSAEALVAVIRGVRRRWRLRTALWGAALALAVAIPIVLGAAFAMDQLRFASWAVWTFRAAAYGGLVVAVWWLLIRPLRVRVSDEQVALYLEEHYPQLDGVLVSAVEIGRARAEVDGPMVERLIADAVRHCDAVDQGRAIERPRLKRASGLLTGATAVAALVLLTNPGFLSHGAPFLLRPWASAAPPYAILVQPGDVTVARGADLGIAARLSNFQAEEVVLFVRRGEGEDWDRILMPFDADSAAYTLLLLDLTEPTEYLVQAAGVRSPLHRIAVADLPYTQRIDLEYHFPRYTGLPAHTDEDGGDIAALRGTRVLVHVTPTIAVAAGGLVVGDDTVPLAPDADGRWAGELVVGEPASYHVVLGAPATSSVTASPDYLIDPLADQPPIVVLDRPGRDLAVTNVDEVFAEVRAADDFGLANVELRYRVNGGDEQTVNLTGAAAGQRELVAGHTLYLEELPLQPGDVVAYYARATDRRSTPTPQVGTSDIYFLEIRPFDRIYRQGDQAAAPSGQGGGGNEVGELSQRQREIVAGTFRVVRDSATFEATAYRDNMGTLALGQGRLREDVADLVGRIRQRGLIGLDSTFALVADALDQAVTAMSKAETQLGERAPRDAMPPEQQALQQLQRAEAAFREREVQQGGQQGGGGGGGGQAATEDLADLFQLELDRQRNQYEQVQRGQQEQADQEMQQLEERLRELARRQQQENERLRAQAQQSGATSGSAQRGQRSLAAEAEELSRQLQRLARERSRPELSETARRLQEAADAMRRAAARRETAEGETAADRLREARQSLDESRAAGLRETVSDALQRAERLAEQQRDVARDVARLADDDATQRSDRLQRLRDRKAEMMNEVNGIESQLDRMARDAHREQPDAARGLRRAAESVRDDRIADKLSYSRGVIQGPSNEYARNFEAQIQRDLDSLSQRIQDAMNAIGESSEQRVERALEQTRDVARALQSLADRAATSGDSGGGGAEPANRQMQRELSERRQQLDQLRQTLGREGIDARDLGRLSNMIGRMDRSGPIGTPDNLEVLRTQVVQGIKDFEFGVRRALGMGEHPATLTAADEVPAEYRALVEEYYRRLAQRRRP